jgi:hypothetical protein
MEGRRMRCDGGTSDHVVDGARLKVHVGKAAVGGTLESMVKMDRDAPSRGCTLDNVIMRRVGEETVVENFPFHSSTSASSPIAFWYRQQRLLTKPYAKKRRALAPPREAGLFLVPC